MKIEQVSLNFIEMPLKSPFETSFGVETKKTCWIVTLSSGGVTGYAESVADVEPLYSEETHASVYYAVKNHIVPRLAGVTIAHPGQVHDLLLPIRGNRMAKAVVEMAVWDWWGRAYHQPLWQLLGGDPNKKEIPVGVSIGIQANPEALIGVAEGYLQEGYRRLKVKIKPGMDVIPLGALRQAVGPSVAIMADANSAYRLDRDLERLRQFDQLDLMMIEQPLDEDDYVDHAVLAKALSTPVCLDESIRSADDARRAIGLGAAGVINIKVGRVGGLQSAKAVHDVAMRNRIPVWCGGMLETGIGRAFNLHLTTLPNFSLPGDTSASDRYFDQDLIDRPFTLNANGTLTVPLGDGIGVRPDPARLREVTTYQEAWGLSTRGVRGGVPDVAGLGF